MGDFKFCTNCGNRIPKDTKFCPYCGHQQAIEKSTAPDFLRKINDTNTNHLAPFHSKKINHESYKQRHTYMNNTHKSVFKYIILVVIVLLALGFGYHKYKSSPMSINMNKELYSNTWSVKGSNPSFFSANTNTGTGTIDNVTFNSNSMSYDGQTHNAHVMKVTGRNTLEEKIGDKIPGQLGPGNIFNFKLVHVYNDGKKLDFQATDGNGTLLLTKE